MIRQPAVGGGAASVEQRVEEAEIGVEINAQPQRGQRHAFADIMDQHLAIAPLGQAFVIDQAADEIDRAQFAQQISVEIDLGHTRGNLDRALRRARALDWVDLHNDDVATGLHTEQREQRGVAGVATVPIRRAINHHRLKQLRQAGRRHDVIGGELRAIEDADAPRLHIRGADKKLDRCAVAHALEINQLLHHLLQRIHVERIEIVGAGPARSPIGPERGVALLRPARQKGVQKRHHRRAAIGVGAPSFGHAFPEFTQTRPRARGAAFGETVGQHHRAHRARR